MTHLFVSDTDGALYDTREANWPSRKPLRANFQRTFREIKSLSELKATLRNGQYAQGGYPIVLYIGFNEWSPVSFDGVRKDWKRIVSAMLDPYDREWHIVGCDIHWEGAPLICELTGQEIESAYGDPEEEAA